MGKSWRVKHDGVCPLRDPVAQGDARGVRAVHANHPLHRLPDRVRTAGGSSLRGGPGRGAGGGCEGPGRRRRGGRVGASRARAQGGSPPGGHRRALGNRIRRQGRPGPLGRTAGHSSMGDRRGGRGEAGSRARQGGRPPDAPRPSRPGHQGQHRPHHRRASRRLRGRCQEPPGPDRDPRSRRLLPHRPSAHRGRTGLLHARRQDGLAGRGGSHGPRVGGPDAADRPRAVLPQRGVAPLRRAEGVPGRPPREPPIAEGPAPGRQRPERRGAAALHALLAPKLPPK